MAGTYELWLTTDAGARIALLDNALWFTATRVVNDAGWFQLGLPESFDMTLIKPDRMVQIWRASKGGRLSLWRSYFVRKWHWETLGSTELLTLSGPDANDLLRRRIVANYASLAQSRKVTMAADDMMKEIVDEQMVNDASNPASTYGSRDYANLTVQADLTLGPLLTKSFSWQKVNTLLKSISEAAREAGTEIFFDIAVSSVGSDSINFEFRTYTGQPGRDRTELGIVFDQARGNLENPSLEYDYSEEVNYVYAAGQGQQDQRETTQVYDTARIGTSIWNRCEGFADARQQGELGLTNGVREEGRARLEEGRPQRRFGGQPVDTEGTRFGRDWDHGDKVRARYRGEEFDCIIRTTNIHVDEMGHETITARLEYRE